MGYDAYSYAVYGFKTTIKDISEKATVRGCGCATPVDSTYKFCPECGKPAFLSKLNTALDGFEGKGRLTYFYPDCSGSRNPDTQIVVGFELAYAEGLSIQDVPAPTPEMLTAIQEFARQKGIRLDVSQVGIKLFTYHSY